MRRLPWMQIAAYALLALAVAATALAFALLHTWDSPRIPGAGPGYRYLALGYRRPTGEDFAGISSITMARLHTILPPDFGLGSAFGNDVTIGTKPHGASSKLHAELVVGDFLQALHVHPLMGRLISTEDQRHGAPVAMLSQREARRLFGHARDAIGRAIFTAQGFELRVVGVLPEAFQGGMGVSVNGPIDLWVPYTLLEPLNSGHWSKGMPTVDMVKAMPFMGPSPLLSLPDAVSDAQLAVDLQRLMRNAHALSLPHDVTAFVVTRPYSPFPAMQRTLNRRIRLSLALAAATLGLAAINLLVVSWLAWLRRHRTLWFERVLGARQGYLVGRFVRRTAWSLLAMLTTSAALIVGFVLLLRHFQGSDYGSVLALHRLLPILLWALPLLVLVVVLAQAFPLAALLARESIDEERVATATRSDRRAGMALIVVEVLLAALLSIASSWSISRGWQSIHADLGFLDRPVTLLETRQAGFSMGVVSNSDAAFRLAMGKVVAAAQAIAPGVPVGFGPALQREADFDHPGPVSAGKRVTSACVVSATTGWLQAIGAHVLAGQSFDIGKVDDGDVLIDAQVARLLFGSPRAAVGNTIRFQNESGSMRVIGVVATLHLHGSFRPACPLVLQDMRSTPYELLGNYATLAVGRALDAGGRAQLRDRIDVALRQQALRLKVSTVRTTTQEREWLAQQQIEQARVFALIALFAWAIALSGVAAHLRLFLAMRKRLTAIRSALGAGPLRLYREVVLGTLALAAAGVLLALLAAPWLAAQFAFLSGAQVAAFGAATWVALAVLLLAVFAVVHFPARRAARAEPAESLHEL